MENISKVELEKYLKDSFDLESIKHPALVGDRFCFIQSINTAAWERFNDNKPLDNNPKFHIVDFLRDYVKVPEKVIFCFLYNLYQNLLQTILHDTKHAYTYCEFIREKELESIEVDTGWRKLNQLDQIEYIAGKNAITDDEFKEANNEIKQRLAINSKLNASNISPFFANKMNAFSSSEQDALHIVRLHGVQTKYPNFDDPKYIDIHCTFKTVFGNLMGIQAMIPIATKRIVDEQAKVWKIFSDGLLHSMGANLQSMELALNLFAIDCIEKTADQEKHYESCSREIQKLKRVVSFFKGISNAEEAVQLPMERIDIEEFIESLNDWSKLQLCVRANQSQCINFEKANIAIEIQPNIPNLVFYRNLLEICCEELFFNAIKNCDPENGDIKVIVTYDEKAKVFHFVFRNNGVGISDEDETKIYDTGYGKGGGIGLALIKICTQRVEQMDIELIQQANPTIFRLSVKE